MENDENISPSAKRSRVHSEYLLRNIKPEISDDYELPLGKRSVGLSEVGAKRVFSERNSERCLSNFSNYSIVDESAINFDNDALLFTANIAKLGVESSLSSSAQPMLNSTTIIGTEPTRTLSFSTTTEETVFKRPVRVEALLERNGFKPVRIMIPMNECRNMIRRCKMFRDDCFEHGSTQSFSSFDSKSSARADSPNVYEVEKILGIRKEGLTKEYFMKWKDYPYNVSSWEKSAAGCSELVEAFKKRQRVLCLILSEVRFLERPLYKSRYSTPSFFLCQRWEDELVEHATSHGQGPIYVENWVDMNLRLRNFRFITTNEITNEAREQFQEPKNLVYCKCSSNGCGSCKDCCPDIFGMKYPYTSVGRVRRNFNIISEWLVECADQCACGPDCPTRVVQRGRQIPVLIFRTMDRGWSVRTMENIRENTFVMEYIGEVVTLERAKLSSLATYQFEMDACNDSAFVVDALKCGNEARFVNHSCDPNMVVRGVFSDRYDRRYHRIAYFAARDISRGEELTINYFSKLSDDEFKKLTRKKSNKSCFCKAKNCRGFII